MGHFKDQLIPEYRDKDPQKYCSKCEKMISDQIAYNNKGVCDVCKEINE
ncbi:hypothetical protein [Lysinibacillus contaminans]|nr:hypothetical protein [Lysinibacillus contaminans]